MIEAIENDKVSSDFTQISLVIDGFTRFSAEEERIVDLLHGKGVETLSLEFMLVRKPIPALLARGISTKPVWSSSII